MFDSRLFPELEAVCPGERFPGEGSPGKGAQHPIAPTPAADACLAIMGRGGTGQRAEEFFGACLFLFLWFLITRAEK